MAVYTLPLLFLFLSFHAFGTHLLGGYIGYESIGNYEFHLTVNLLTDAQSAVSAGTGTLDFGDGSFKDGEFNTTVTALSDHVNLVTLTIPHVYAGPGVYHVAYSEQNYNAGINNIPNAISTPFLVSSLLVIDPIMGENSSPVLQLYGAQSGLSGMRQLINLAPLDPDDDSLSFRLIHPPTEAGSSFPNDPAFYDDYNSGNQAGDGPPEYTINPASGEIVWDAPGLTGEYAIAFNVLQWRKNGSDWVNMGETEVVLIDRISDAEQDIFIEVPAAKCYENVSDVQALFSIVSAKSDELNVEVFSDAEAGEINGLVIDPDQPMKFDFTNSLELTFTAPPDLDKYHLYRVVLTIGHPEFRTSATWMFAIGCDELPSNILPDQPDKPEPPAPTPPEAFNIYPNPSAKDFIHVTLPGSSDLPKHIRVIDIFGRILYNRQIILRDPFFSLDISDFGPGPYLIQVNHHKGKFIVL